MIKDILLKSATQQMLMLLWGWLHIKEWYSERDRFFLERASKRIDLLHEETEQLYQASTVSPQLCELRNLITIGYLIVKGASFRKESRGLHFNTDYPEKSDLVQNTIL